MERYAVCKLKGQAGLFAAINYPGLISDETAVLAPLKPKQELPDIPVLVPIVKFDEREYQLLTYRLAALNVAMIETTLGTLDEDAVEYPIQRALSRLFFGN